MGVRFFFFFFCRPLIILMQNLGLFLSFYCSLVYFSSVSLSRDERHECFLSVSACGLGEQIAQERKRDIFSLSACGFRKVYWETEAFCLYGDISLYLDFVCASEPVSIVDNVNTIGQKTHAMNPGRDDFLDYRPWVWERPLWWRNGKGIVIFCQDIIC